MHLYLNMKNKMKLSVLFLMLTMFCASASVKSYSQVTEISIHLENTTVKKALDEIKSESQFSFWFRNGEVNLSKTVTVNMDHQNIRKVLDAVLAGQDLAYSIDEKHIVIYKNQESSAQINSIQQEKAIRGTVVDDQGIPIIGANVVIKGTTNGSITDLDGNFILQANKGDLLTVSYIGYNSQEIRIKDQTAINIILKEDSQALDEVVVVGYGVQKKANVIGSIAQIGAEKLENRSTPKLSNALTGQMSGVTVIQRSGQPGVDGGEVRIRGVGSFGATPSALVLIDGIPGDMNDVNSDDVETVSVLKDASTAAIYGARAANGVILITTKNGTEGKVKVSYNGYVGFNKATELPQFVDTWRYAELVNEVRQSEVYTAEDIQKYKDGSDPEHYGNFNYLEDVLSRNGFQTGHDISINGGDKKNKYMLSFGYLDQEGLVEKNDYKRYNARINLVNQLASNLTLTSRMSGMYSMRNEPNVPGGDDANGLLGIIQKAVRYPGLTPSILSDGTYTTGREHHGTAPAWVDSDSFLQNPNYTISANLKLDYEPIKDLKLSAIGAYENTSIENKNYKSTITLEDGTIPGPSSLTEETNRTIYKTFQATANYSRTFGVHNIDVLAGYSWEQEDYHNLIGSRDNFPGNDLPYIDAGAPDNQTSEGTAWGWAIQSYFGRVKYNYAERYLFESTFRYDGSSRFPDDNKYGFFPSLAAGWRVSEESFMKDNEDLSWISGLKFKVSWGRLGNQNVPNNYYPYQSVYALGENYAFGDSYSSGAAINVATDPTLKWEETETYDIGMESVLFNGKLTFNASYFHRNTYDILYKPTSSVSTVLGQSTSQMNMGEMNNSGWEFELGHQNKVGEVSYNVNANLTLISNEVATLGVGNVTQLNGMVGNGSSLFIGYPMQMYYGYQTDGVFLNDGEVAEWADQTAVNPSSQAGDFRYKDISGPDGVPDGEVDPNYDRTFLGSRIPKYTFGLNLGAEYKGFDFSALFQGVADVKGYMNYFAGFALANQGNIQEWQGNCFDPENPVRNPEYPRIQDLGNSTPPNYQTSDFWVLNASYVRLKNLQLGYTLPKHITSSIGIENLRFYLQGENLFCINSYREGWDPEINGTGSYYPILATYTFGVNLKF